MGKREILENYRGLYGIVDLAFKDHLPPVEWAKIFVRNSIKVIQLRGKKVSDAELFKWAEKLREVIPEEFIFIVNDRPDIALLTGADGVHVGQDDIPPDAVKEKFSHLIVGFSTHNFAQFLQAEKTQADYAGFGPIFPTTSKDKPDPVTGIKPLEEVVSRKTLPVVAIGGINRERLIEILNVVCPEMFSVVSAIALSSDPEEEVIILQETYLTRCRK